MLVSNSTHMRFAAALAVLLLTACGQSTPEAPTAKTATPAAAAATAVKAPVAEVAPAKPSTLAAAPASASPAFRVSAVTLGNAVDSAHKITQPGTRFTPAQRTIYASVASTGNTQDTALNARWSYLEGAGQLISSVTQHLATDGPAVTTFTLQNPDLWPEGKYNVEISVDGKVVDTQAFTIDK